MNDRRGRREDTSKLDVSSSQDKWVKMQFMSDPFNSNKFNPHYAVCKNGIMIVLTSSEITYSMEQVKLGIRACDLKIRVCQGGRVNESHSNYGDSSYIAIFDYRELPANVFKKNSQPARNLKQPSAEFFINKAIVDMICHNNEHND